MILGAIALLLVALALVAAELFVPSHGVLSIIAALTAIGSIFLAAKASAGLALIFGVIIFLAAPVVVYYAIKMYPTTKVGKRVMLDPRQPGTVPGPAFADEQARLEELVGRQGTAMTLLRPAGSIDIAGRRIDAVSESDMIEPGAKVEVMKVVGMKVIVKPLA